MVYRQFRQKSCEEYGEGKMKSVIIGLVIIAAAVFAILPVETLGFGLGWGDDVLAFLRGGLPVIAIVIGIIAVFIGIADIKDRAEAKKEEAEKKEEATR
jgi:large-conductance mechanosensitive channel